MSVEELYKLWSEASVVLPDFAVYWAQEPTA